MTDPTLSLGSSLKGKNASPLGAQERSPPPPYKECTSKEMTPDITAAFSSLNLNAPSSGLPSPDLCLAHLKLLEAFHQLRDEISQRDDMFGIKDTFATNNHGQAKDELRAKIREKRWAVFVTRAARRFEQWWNKTVLPTRLWPSWEGDDSYGWLHNPTRAFTSNDLPPLGE